MSQHKVLMTFVSLRNVFRRSLFRSNPEVGSRKDPAVHVSLSSYSIVKERGLVEAGGLFNPSLERRQPPDRLLSTRQFSSF